MKPPTDDNDDSCYTFTDQSINALLCYFYYCFSFLEARLKCSINVPLLIIDLVAADIRTTKLPKLHIMKLAT